MIESRGVRRNLWDYARENHSIGVYQAAFEAVGLRGGLGLVAEQWARRRAGGGGWQR